VINELILTTGQETTISRDTWPSALVKNYETVIVREGKPAIDAEVNELGDITLKERLELTRDMFYDGCIKGDVFGDGIVRESFEVTWDGVNVKVAPGRMRLAQRRCDLTSILSSGVSGNALSGFTPPSVGVGNFKYIYVDVYRREYYGNPANPATNATPTVPGNDPTLSDPVLGGEQARRIQFFNPATDIKAAPQNTGVSPASGHTIQLLAKVYRDSSNVIQVQDMRTFGGVKAGHTIAEFVVRAGGTPTVDCTHNDFMDAYADALLVAGTRRVTIWVIDGSWTCTQPIVLNNWLSIIGRTPRSAIGPVGTGLPALAFNGGSPTVTLQPYASMVNMRVIGYQNGPTLLVSGTGAYLKNVKAENALFPNVTTFQLASGTGHIVVDGCDLQVVDAGQSAGNTNFHDCLSTGGFLGNNGVKWFDSTFNVAGAVGLTWGWMLQGCTITGTFTWTTNPATATRLYSCDMPGADITINDSGLAGHLFELYGCSLSYIRHTACANDRFTTLVGSKIGAIFCDSSVPMHLVLYDSSVTGEVHLYSSNATMHNTSVSTGTDVDANGIINAYNCSMADVRVKGSGTIVTCTNCFVSSVAFDAPVTSGSFVWASCTFGNYGGTTVVGCSHSFFGGSCFNIDLSKASIAILNGTTVRGILTLGQGAFFNNISVSSSVNQAVTGSTNTFKNCQLPSILATVDDVILKFYNCYMDALSMGSGDVVMYDCKFDTLSVAKVVNNAAQSWGTHIYNSSGTSITVNVTDASVGNPVFSGVNLVGNVSITANGTAAPFMFMDRLNCAACSLDLSVAADAGVDSTAWRVKDCTFTGGLTVNLDHWNPTGSPFKFSNCHVDGLIELTAVDVQFNDLEHVCNFQIANGIIMHPTSGAYINPTLTLVGLKASFNGIDTSSSYIQGGVAPSANIYFLRMHHCRLYQVYTPRVFNSLSTTALAWNAIFTECSFELVAGIAGAVITLPATSTVVLEQSSLRVQAGQLLVSAGVTYVAPTAIVGTSSTIWQ
jgi:hypothetical protein